jgi:hypothetical protein
MTPLLIDQIQYSSRILKDCVYAEKVTFLANVAIAAIRQHFCTLKWQLRSLVSFYHRFQCAWAAIFISVWKVPLQPLFQEHGWKAGFSEIIFFSQPFTRILPQGNKWVKMTESITLYLSLLPPSHPSLHGTGHLQLRRHKLADSCRLHLRQIYAVFTPLYLLLAQSFAFFTILHG